MKAAADCRSAEARRVPPLLAAALLLFAATVTAGLPDQDQPATIESDRAEMDQRAGVYRYFGNVVFTQGTLRITGDRMDIETHEGELQRAEVRGEPARARQQTEEGDWVNARALEMVYEPVRPRLTLIGRAELVRDDDVFTAAYIEYDPATGWIQAESDDDERVHITFQPQREEDNDESGDSDSNGDDPGDE